MALLRKNARIRNDSGVQVVLTNRPDRYFRGGETTLTDGCFGRNWDRWSITWLGFYLEVVYRGVIRLLVKFYPQDIVPKKRSQNHYEKERKGAGHPEIA